MGIFSGLFRFRDKPQNRTAGSNYAFFLGGTTSGKTVTERSAMQMTAVYSCVRILSEAVAGLPLHLYKYTDNGGKTMALDHPLYRLLHDEPNPEMSSFVFRETLMTHLLLWGNAYAQIIRNGKNEVIALYPLMPNKMTVDRDENGRLYYTYYRGQDEAIRDKEFAVTLLPTDVLHIPGLGFDGLVGYSPIAMAKNAIGMAIACEEYGAKFFANGAAPGGVLEHPGTIKDPQRVRESWMSQFGGSAKTIAPTKAQQAITPDSGYYGLSDVTVSAIPDAYQDVSSVTAGAADTLTGKVLVTSDGKVTTGTMPNNGAVSKTLDAGTPSYTVPKGYHSGTGKVSVAVETKTVTPTKAAQDIVPSTGKVLTKVSVAAIPDEFVDTSDADALATNILDGKTAFVNGEKIIGSMPNNGGVSATMDGLTATSVVIPAGYTSGGTVSLTSDIEEALAAI